MSKKPRRPNLWSHLCPCAGSRCAALHGLAPFPGHAILGRCRHPAPAGWGFYLRQRLGSDERAPLMIVDELGGVTLYRDK